ncbi:hypothetical protein [Alicyclobacillus dauci]|uniref:Uncharacterized protein n=1 Tax=Alicyclobacillus dauci TaxID=1475485 RepID=A0ABY6Z5M7_9BACL|nr:hypothetical protein [Alicyclobacillus dauci]WAH37626.1 hypothetical protein NZD86_03605 [Alicyclobacillus dauci]
MEGKTDGSQQPLYQVGSYTQEIENTLFQISEQLRDEGRQAWVTPVDAEVPTWSVTVGSKAAPLTIYDVEENRSEDAQDDTPGLNVQLTTREAVDKWVDRTFE